MLLEPKTFALLFTVVLLAVTAYFLLGSVPLLTLKHDNPMDSRFIRSFYMVYFRISLVAATAACISYGLAARPGLACGAAAIALLTILMRKHLISRMDVLSAQIRANEIVAIPSFLSVHKSAIWINSTQLVAILMSLTTL
jgi:hypothetical protein